MIEVKIEARTPAELVKVLREFGDAVATAIAPLDARSVQALLERPNAELEDGPTDPDPKPPMPLEQAHAIVHEHVAQVVASTEKPKAEPEGASTGKRRGRKPKAASAKDTAAAPAVSDAEPSGQSVAGDVDATATKAAAAEDAFAKLRQNLIQVGTEMQDKLGADKLQVWLKENFQADRFTGIAKDRWPELYDSLLALKASLPGKGSAAQLSV